jgi:DNA invertase Pin-like site-specific DNA recombinase
MPKPLVYARYSPRPNAQDCDSSDRQIADLVALIAKEGHAVDPAHIFRDDDEHGHDWERPGLWEALRCMEEGDTLYVRALDRIARDSGILAFVRHQIHTRGGTIRTLDNGDLDPANPVSVFMSTILGAVAELQRSITARRTQTGFHNKLKEGKWHKTWFLPYGYQWLDKEAGRIEPSPEELEVIELIKKLFRAGKSRQAIAEELNETGTLWREGKPWDRQKVRSVLDHGQPKKPKRQRMPKL